MNKNILNTINQEFINENINSNTADLLLKKNHHSDVDIKLLVEQIEAKKRCKTKLPTWFNTEKIYYPNKLNIEQTSSEVTAKYKSSLITGNSIIDLTGGFGIDCYYFSKKFKEVTHCEINSELSEIVSHNYKELGVNTIETITNDGVSQLLNNNKQYDWVYIDPSRRHDTKGKVFFLKDCLPDVPKQLNTIFNHTNNVMIKTSPLLDISVGISELNYVKTIHVITVNNEVKELLWILEKGVEAETSIKTVNINKTVEETFDFKLNEEQAITTNFSEPLTYLYEPNAAVLKSGGFKSVSKQLNVLKLHQHTHLYTLQDLVEFPGRRFKIERVLPYNKQLLKKELHEKANISTRNFPEAVQQIRKKFKIKDGGDTYVFFTTNLHNEKIVIICKKVS
ncbi:class I SAM-dependent methyltransferase [Meridianimaribacter sp. CL38]|uniref:THUMP-like domain-containing protein n=1 Tax=Meridianimaribacter sp. CL38 TaxID=2213021 RepID=UPI00103A1645|nr:RsmD family RNA methyltransferase [Meridianimaribacter sp. CL38]TBV26553.1 class I SAM-dependent methyltransferase [Meridianimaribacter sp. CL38]